MEHHDHSCCHKHEKKVFYKNKTFIVTCVLLALMGLSYVIPLLVPFRESMIMYTGAIWWALLLGLAIGGAIEYYVPKEYIINLLARSEAKSIFNAVIMGFFMSICSHGILALAIQLHKKGASTSSVIAFLLASPWANLPLTLLLISFFGLTKALYIILVAIVIAITTGFVFQALEKKNWVEVNKHQVELDEDFSIFKDVKKKSAEYKFSLLQSKKDLVGIFKGSVSLSNMVLWWILIGTGAAALAGAYIPSDIFKEYMGPNFGGMLVTLLVATIIEVCSEGTAPLAFEIFNQTGALGNSLVFLMAGVSTDYTEIGLLWHNVGRKTAIWLPVVTVPQVIFWGYLANKIF